MGNTGIDIAEIVRESSYKARWEWSWECWQQKSFTKGSRSSLHLVTSPPHTLFITSCLCPLKLFGRIIFLWFTALNLRTCYLPSNPWESEERPLLLEM